MIDMPAGCKRNDQGAIRRELRDVAHELVDHLGLCRPRILEELRQLPVQRATRGSIHPVDRLGQSPVHDFRTENT